MTDEMSSPIGSAMVLPPDFVDLDRRMRTIIDQSIMSGRPMYFSQLGKELGAELGRVKAVSGMTLSDYADRYLSQDYDIQIMGGRPNIRAFVARRADAENAHKAHTSVPSEERFNYRFWAAFSVPLTAGKRYLNMETLVFEDGDSEPSGHVIEIEPLDIPSDNIDSRDAAIKRSIYAWLERHDLRAESFLARKTSRKDITTCISKGRTLLEEIISALDQRQLQSVSLPLDVIAKLHNRKG